jgi:hypothetical protein
MDMVILALSKIGFSLLMSLLTEGAVKRLLVHSLEVLAAKTENEWDNKVVADVRKAWAVED